MNIVLKKTNKYGVVRYYPKCANAEILTKILKQKSLTERDLSLIMILSGLSLQIVA